MTAFQRSITKEDIIQVCLLMYPGSTSDQFEHVKWYPKFSWVCVGFKAKKIGYVSFGMDNHYSGCALIGQISKEQIEKALSEGKIRFNVWRFIDDAAHQDEQEKEEEKRAAAYLSVRYKLPSMQEYHKYYFSED